MLNLTPPVKDRFHIEVMVTFEELKMAKFDIEKQLKEDGACRFIHCLVDKFSTQAKDTFAVKYTLDVVVLTIDEWRDKLNAAYANGLRDGARTGFMLPRS